MSLNYFLVRKKNFTLEILLLIQSQTQTGRNIQFLFYVWQLGIKGFEVLNWKWKWKHDLTFLYRITTRFVQWDEAFHEHYMKSKNQTRKVRWFDVFGFKSSFVWDAKDDLTQFCVFTFYRRENFCRKSILVTVSYSKEKLVMIFFIFFRSKLSTIAWFPMIGDQNVQLYSLRKWKWTNI